MFLILVSISIDDGGGEGMRERMMESDEHHESNSAGDAQAEGSCHV